MDKFPEAFERFEEAVDVDKIRSFQELRDSFALWSGKNWKATRKQTEALWIEARKRGIHWEIPRYCLCPEADVSAGLRLWCMKFLPHTDASP